MYQSINFLCNVRVKKGQVLEVLTDYDGALEDIPAWCEKCGQEFVGLEKDIEYVLEKLPRAVEKLRELSPIWREKAKV